MKKKLLGWSYFFQKLYFRTLLKHQNINLETVKPKSIDEKNKI